MNRQRVDQVVRAVLYEGYILYPYRRSTKSQQRWTFGGVFPRDYSEKNAGLEPWFMQTQCLLRGHAKTQVRVEVAFLHVVDRAVGSCGPNGAGFEPRGQFEVDGKIHQQWQEALERTITVELELDDETAHQPFHFPAGQSLDLLPDANGAVVGAIQRTWHEIRGVVTVRADAVKDGVHRITVRAENRSPVTPDEIASRQRAQLHSMASTHALLSASDGIFISMIDPPAELAAATHECRQSGAWPVLIGEPGEMDAMLASPIILYDHPEVAAESPGDLYDGCEIDEILSLRVMTLTDGEKRAASDLDPRAADLIGRTDALARDQLSRLHGAMRPPRKVQAVHVGASELRAGDKVRLAPTGRADAFDIILRGKAATIAAIEQDYENRIHVAVTLDDDPGADIGAAGLIGHRFFFKLDEIEPLHPSAEKEVGTA